MINRLVLKHKVETLSDSEIAEVLEYINIMESVRKQAKSPDPLEEMILSLLLQAMSDEQGCSDEFLRQERAITN